MANISNAERARRAAAAAAAADTVEPTVDTVEQPDPVIPNVEQPIVPVEQTTDTEECRRLRSLSADQANTIADQTGAIAVLNETIEALHKAAKARKELLDASAAGADSSCYRMIVYGGHAIDHLTLTGKLGYPTNFRRINLKGVYCHEKTFPTYAEAEAKWEDIFDGGRRMKYLNVSCCKLIPVTGSEAVEIAAQRASEQAEIEEREAATLLEVHAARAEMGWPPVNSHEAHVADVAARRADASAAAIIQGAQP